ncbi:hypothetical protein CR513_04185, partial [Mucuna pruriens]
MESSHLGMSAHKNIINFSQYQQEPLVDVCERFQEMLCRYPHHDFPKGFLIQILYNNISTLNQTSIDVAYEGMIRKSPLAKHTPL